MPKTSLVLLSVRTDDQYHNDKTRQETLEEKHEPNIEETVKSGAPEEWAYLVSAMCHSLWAPLFKSGVLEWLKIEI